jgi:murein DD-endopeptidase MepM/ murein hydrolase activator NlpD
MTGRINTGLAVLVGLILSCLLWLVSAEGAIAQDIPTTIIESEGQYAPVPDWSKITFGTLPAILSDGKFAAPANVNQILGYDISRTWQAGDRANTYLKLGDFQNSLYLQIFNLYTISQISGFDPSQVALSSLEMASWQTIDDLVTAIPGLGSYQVEDVVPIAALLKNKIPMTPGWNPNAESIGSTIADVLTDNPELGKLSLGELDNLGEFSLSDIPDLTNVPLQNFSDWGNSAIAGVPGLSDVPLDQMPNPLDVLGFIATVDVVYGTAESDRTNTISGSQQAGFSVNCQQNCAHAELTENTSVYGKQWISGQHQEVEGGFGVLKTANGGKEPTGRHPFGNAFKVVVWDTEESTGSVSTALFFRVCYRGIPDLGCTPYFLGPVPFLSYQEKDPIFIGLLDLQGGASNPASILEGVMDTARDWGIPESALSGGVSSSGSLCGTGIGGVDFEALASAFSSIEGNYGSVGSFTCADSGANCGRGLGRYQYMSYRSDVRQVISQKEGGSAFLARLDSGESVGEAELERFFSKPDQDNLFKADQTQNINQAIAEGFTGSKIIERVGQIHFGGSGATIGGGASDVHGRLSLKTYGEELRGQYESATQTKGDSNCGKANGKLTNPVPGTPVLSEVGWRVHPIYGDERFHSGIDLAAAEGTPVKAADGGTVTFARVDGSMTSGYGQMIIIDHGNGRETRYAHLSTMDVKEGQQIAQGDVLGKVGSTGGVTGAHLHFEVRENAEPIDPRQYINF